MHRTRNPANRFYRRAGSNPVLTLRFEEVIIWLLTSFSFFLLTLHKKDYVYMEFYHGIIYIDFSIFASCNVE